ncbi:SIS domain-containing protein [Actinocorallia sp. API 0066]|uniref:SIS domain-containing protein n=1 Tax=Actinocorallia sp. API 0066 TaxID=2896846 RepID=UPI001E2CCB1C|nr:SIS domain-containing protein [Actinocorallia sp. API 0066]MCD0451620.1 SIS domain-containing protein [Actinocorallia sp. API 0066]
MSGYSAAHMLRQSRALGADLRALLPRLEAEADTVVRAASARPVRRVVLTGSGDSYHAALAAAMAFESLAALRCDPVPTQRFLDYGAVGPGADGTGTLVVGISSSGRNRRLAEALRRAGPRGSATLAVTADPDSAVALAADHRLVVRTSAAEPSPGILTYQASLAALAVVAVRLAGRRGPVPPETLLRELRALPDEVERTAAAVETPCGELAAKLVAARPDGPGPLAVTGTGPALGTAKYAAAKVVEACGVAAFGQDLEEWWHVERHARPGDAPLVVLAPRGRAAGRAAELARGAVALGRPVVVVGPHDAGTPPGSVLLPVLGAPREEWTPLLHHVFAGFLGARLALELGRVPFTPV